MKWRVRVGYTDYGRVGVVFVTRRPFTRFYQNGVLVAMLDLTRDDAEEQLAAARAKARSLAVGITHLEGPVTA